MERGMLNNARRSVRCLYMHSGKKKFNEDTSSDML